ncbi:hypothetical protein D3C80_1196180 [compost metagenome]
MDALLLHTGHQLFKPLLTMGKRQGLRQTKAEFTQRATLTQLPCRSPAVLHQQHALQVAPSRAQTAQGQESSQAQHSTGGPPQQHQGDKPLARVLLRYLEKERNAESYADGRQPA